MPLFLYITGYLLLDKHYDNQACKRFWKTKWLPLFLSIEAWIVIYDIFLAWHDGSVTLAALAKNMLFLENVEMMHFWYMPMIIGFYAFLPLVANALKYVSNKTLLFPVLLSFLLFLIVPTLGILNELRGGSRLASTISQGFSGGVYGCYLLLGLLVKRGAFNRFSSLALGALGILSFAVVVVMQIECHLNGLSYNVWYTNCLLAICALCLFVLISRAKERGLLSKKLAFLFAKYSFAIYLVHVPILKLLSPKISTLCLSLSFDAIFVCTALLALSTFLLSLLISMAIARIPLGDKLLYMR